jgi:glycerophosphoryl diester phosphodiesterase
MKFIAHRGWSSKFHENTSEAFKASFERPLNGKSIIGIELDIQMTKDKRMIVFHDSAVDAGRNGVREPVSGFDYKDFCAVAKDIYSCPEVPLFRDTLKLVNHKTTLYTEIKAGGYDTNVLMDQLEEFFAEYKPDYDIVLHSFDIPIMTAALGRFEKEKIKFGFLFESMEALKNASAAFLDSLDFLHPYFKTVLEHDAELLRYGKPLNIWTVDDIETVRALERSKCGELTEGIMTNDLALAETM